jgi:dinuclear metal center YbgI/SA1388 family protein
MGAGLLAEDARGGCLGRLRSPRVFPPVVPLAELVSYCDQRLGVGGFPDYPGAMNGLQVANAGTVGRIGAAVDAGLEPFRRATQNGIEFLIVHHGLFWEPPRPWVGVAHERLNVLLRGNLAVYSAHLPLDAHPELGNNVVLARRLQLEPSRGFMPFEGRDVGVIAKFEGTRTELRRRLEALFPRVTAMEFGGDTPRTVAILTGSAASISGELAAAGVDTLVTGELKEHFFNRAQEEHLNLYTCGHYATEVFGVCALAEELAARFGLPWEFIATQNPL